MHDQSHLSIKKREQPTSKHKKTFRNFVWCSLLCSVPRKNWNHTYVTMIMHALSMWEDNISIWETFLDSYLFVGEFMFDDPFDMMLKDWIKIKVKGLCMHKICLVFHLVFCVKKELKNSCSMKMFMIPCLNNEHAQTLSEHVQTQSFNWRADNISI